MSSLNSLDPADIIRTVVFGGKIHAIEARASGVDIELLADLFEAVKPELNFVGGHLFKPLTDSFKPYGDSPWHHWIQDFPRADKFDQVVMLMFVSINARVVNPEPISQLVFPTSRAMLRIYLSKRGEWLVWTNYPHNQFEVFKRPEKVIQFAYDILGEGDNFDNHRDSGAYSDGLPKPRPSMNAGVLEPLGSLALEVASELVKFYEQHVAERRRRLEESEEKLESISSLVNNIEV